MDYLTKENFWDDLMLSYPIETRQFCNWIDSYKKRVDWNKLFNKGIANWAPVILLPPNGHKDPIQDIKYHDLPLAMQYGIFLQYMSENGVSGQRNPPDIKIVPTAIRDYFKAEYEFRIATNTDIIE